MDSHGTEHGGEHGSAVHLPDPSIWPLIVGFASLLLGGALVWWSNDRSSDFAGPLAGAAIIFTLAAAAGWTYEDGRMKRKAEQGGHASARDARFTQVLTFAIAEGALPQARSASGILTAIDESDMRDLDGFQDLRITVSPAEVGPSQALVETTWSGREGLASYDGTRSTLLDLLASHSDEVLPGSVQAFDMEVVRDTKETSLGFGLGPAVALLGSLVIGGFMVGAGLNLFKGEGVAAVEGGGGPAVVDPFAVSATDNKFSTNTLSAAPNTAVTFTFTNKGRAKHNLHFLTGKDGSTLAPGAEGAIIDGGITEPISFTTPGPGTYYFLCDVHPDQMNGTFEVKAGGPVPGGAAGGAPSPAAGATARGG